MECNEDNSYLMLSGIQHFQFCKRQWALIHIEQQWEENVRTIEGKFLHQKADQPFIKEKRGNKFTVRAMPIKSNELRITGVCDVVEFIKDNNGIEINGAEGKYIVQPIEYKRGKPKINDSDVLQLTAQAICLEEMLLCEIKTGFIFYNEIKHRIEVPLTTYEKNNVRSIVKEMYDYYKRKYTPKVKTGSFCKSCSLQNLCLPGLMNKRSVKSYIEGKIHE
ncbi:MULTISPECIES: CRISPR-associated protein Cas4 [Bacillus cereus group]|uniref:CRISPR-associated protein Cas4 n=1 Tax=Bacillus cereus group TaxID=86661 RepID=UPI000279B800|nr:MULTISPECIES: CRISPR-associated protein Cas4 [Bacillus cereus group]MED3183913.1 CRISPR-associated protein Cas4 [Bacillus thuringiensis]EJR80194.1 CRISPR-associated protein cas4 [Bacillus cereus VD169]OPA11605.1 CRISPR-associated protein Cas4 [Bacillus cereus]OTX98591.1 CRISPR-associated protein Cas4 [Bacillus thuringiensis serovar kim]OUB13655.1 CRISPR-associated protein Cas4 [Bacillus thuringiensis serovar xiaguangiensis]